MQLHNDHKPAGLVVVLASMAILGGQSFGAEPIPSSALPFHVADSPQAESPGIVEGSNVTFLYQITIPGATAVGYRDVGQFVQGRHEIFPALEREVAGMKPGEEKKVELTAEEGFGPYDDKKKMDVPRTQLPATAKEGAIVQDKAGHFATVAEFSDSTAVLDYNHPLAGKPLVVQVRILKVENPS